MMLGLHWRISKADTLQSLWRLATSKLSTRKIKTPISLIRNIKVVPSNRIEKQRLGLQLTQNAVKRREARPFNIKRWNINRSLNSRKYLSILMNASSIVIIMVRFSMLLRIIIGKLSVVNLVRLSFLTRLYCWIMRIVISV